MTARCEICDRDAYEVRRSTERYYPGAWFQDLPNPYPGPFPQGEGRGWEVAHWVGRDEYVRLTIAEALTRPPLVGVRIMTCGSDVCVFRARVHGVPGATYATPPPSASESPTAPQSPLPRSRSRRA